MSDLGETPNASERTPGSGGPDSGPVWKRQGRPPTVGEAREYFDAHAVDGGDPETLEECERVLDATGHLPSPTSPPPEEVLEERGSD
jgi:hypothetical protein